MSTPAVQWIPPFAGRVAGLSLYLVPKMQLLIGEVITFILPPLVGNSSTFVAQYLLPSGPAPWNASWVSGSKELTLTVGSHVAIDAQIAVHLLYYSQA